MRINKGKITVLFLASIVLVVLTFIACMTFGATDMDIGNAVKALMSGDFENVDFRIFFFVRFPRCIGAVLSGLSLAVSGVLIQAVLNNPMASPNIIGVNSGAGFAVILTVSLYPDFLALIPFSAFLGAFIACLLIFFIARHTAAGIVTITLVGIAVTSILNAAINALKTIFPESVYNFTSFSVGGLAGVNFAVLRYVAPVIILCFVLSVLISRNTDILCLGEQTASANGMNVAGQRFLHLILASALAGCAVSFAGLLGFVGLVVPHIVRVFTGNRHILLIPLAGIFGAEFVLICDLFCRFVFRPYEVPVGIILSFIGGAFFIFLILTRRKGRIYD